MKYWKYEMQNIAVIGTDENGNPITKESFFTKRIPYTAENEEIAKREAYQGKYIVEEIPEEVPEPTWQDKIEAQVTYNSMMLGTLIGEV